MPQNQNQQQVPTINLFTKYIFKVFNAIIKVCLLTDRDISITPPVRALKIRVTHRIRLIILRLLEVKRDFLAF